jgi:hypothetical protein
VSDAIDLQIGDFEHGAAGAAAAAKNGADAGRELGKGEGLRQGIVGAGIEQADMIFREARPDDHQDGQIGFLRTNVAENLQAAFRGQIEIQDYKVVRLVGSETLGFPTVRDHVYGKLFLLQPLMEKLRQRRVIFSDKNAHRQTPDDKFGRGKTIVSVRPRCVNGGSNSDSAKGIPSQVF